MTAALLYRPAQRWQTWVAFACAIALHFAAISVARSVPEVPSFPQSPDVGMDFALDPTPEQTPNEQVEPTPPEPPELVKPDEPFPEDISTPGPTFVRKWKRISPSVRSASASTAGVSGPSFGSMKALAIYAPRPAYPYEARRRGTTGSGLVVLMIDSSTGNVTDVHLAQSTGSSVLDNSAISAFRRWRFKSGTATRVQVPITYTLSGASY